MCASLPYEHWMRDAAALLRERPLHALVLPGSHNAGAVNLRSITVLGFGQGWANTQREPVAAQLRAGIRYLDLHVQYLHVEGAPGPYLVHTPAGGIATFFGQSVAELIGDVRGFLSEHPEEVVIVHFSRFYDMTSERHARLAELLETWLDRRAAPPAFQNATLGKLWAASRQLIVLYGEDRPGSSGRESALAAWPVLWDAATTCSSSPIPEQQPLAGLYQHFDAALQTRPPDQIGVLRGTCTVTAPAMLRGFFRQKAAFTSRAQMAEYLNPRLLGWLAQRGTELPLNVVAIDYSTDSELVATAVRLNREPSYQRLP